MPPPLTDTQETPLKKVYYEENHAFGRDEKMGPKWVAMLLVGGNRQHVMPSCPV